MSSLSTSIATHVMRALGERCKAIRGEGPYSLDVGGRIYFQRPSFDLENEKLPAIFIARRLGGGTTIERKPGADEFADKTVIWDVIGVVERGTDCALVAERLLADIERAIEISDDMLLNVDIGGRRKNLLNEELFIVDLQLEPYLDGFPFELTGVGVQCTWKRKYGDPNHFD